MELQTGVSSLFCKPVLADCSKNHISCVFPKSSLSLQFTFIAVFTIAVSIAGINLHPIMDAQLSQTAMLPAAQRLYPQAIRPAPETYSFFAALSKRV